MMPSDVYADAKLIVKAALGLGEPLAPMLFTLI